jgi:hypothetical protein
MGQLKSHEQRKMIELAMSGMYHGDKRTLSKVFEVLQESGWSPKGYHTLLERADRVVKRAQAAMQILETEEL